MFDFLIPYFEISLPISVVIILLLLAKPLFDKRYAAKMMYYVWLIIALRLIFPFNLGTKFTQKRPVQIDIPNMVVYNGRIDENLLQQPEVNESYTESKTEIFLPEETLNPEISDTPRLQPVESAAPVITITDMLSVVWLTGSLSLILFYIISYKISAAQMRTNARVDYKSQALLANIRNNLGIKQKLAVYRCSGVNSPVIVGIFNPRIYLPDYEISDDILEMMLYHELVHFKRKDITYKLIMLIACCVHWFNPLVWIMNRQAQKDIEISCDEEVIRNKDKEFRKLYSDSIMSVIKLGHKRTPAFSTSFASDKNTIITRFKRIYDNTIKKGGKPVTALILALCIMCSTLVACKTVDASFEIPRQAMDFMEFYCRYNTDETLMSMDKVTQGFRLLTDFGYIPQEYRPYDDINYYHNINMSYLTTVYEFIMAKKAPEQYHYSLVGQLYRGSDTDESYDCHLALIEAKQQDSDTFTATFNRYYDGLLYDKVKFTMEQQTVESVPAGLDEKFAIGDTIWRIKDLQLNRAEYESIVTEISSVDDFLNFQKIIKNNPAAAYKNKFILTDDIDFGGMEIEPVGYISPVFGSDKKFFNEQPYCFMGEFDGQGHTINNFVIKYKSNTPGNYYSPAGLFAGLSKFGSIKNLNIENGTVIPEGRTFNDIGILVGVSSGLIENCHVSGTVHGEQCIGGLAGDIYGPTRYSVKTTSIIRNCSVNATVKGEKQTGVFVGGVTHSRLENNTATGKVTAYRRSNADKYDMAPWRIGGFSGEAKYYTEIINCHADTSIEILNSARTVGAFSSTCEDSQIIGCSYNKSKAGNWEDVDFRSTYHSTVDISADYIGI